MSSAPRSGTGVSTLSSRLAASLTVSAAALALVVGAGIAGAQDDGSAWPMAGGDPAHRGVITGPDPPYGISWQVPVPRGLADAPVVDDGVVVAVGRDRVLALDAASGDALWEVERTPGAAGSPAVADGLVVHASGEGSRSALVARSVDDGRERWRVFTDASLEASPLVAEDHVYVATAAGSILAVGLRDGEVAWQRPLESSIDAPLALAADRLLASAEQTAESGLVTTLLIALDPESGEEQWRFSTPPAAPGASPVSVSGGVAFFGAGDGQVHAVDIQSGQARWASRTETAFSVRPPLFSGSQVPASPGDPIVADLAHVQRFNAASGENLWTFRVVDGLFSSGVTVAGGHALVGEQFSSRVSAIDIESGHRVWRSGDLGDGAATSVAGDGERLYVGVLGSARGPAPAMPGSPTPGEGGPRPVGRIVALEHDPAGTLRSEPSDSTLFLGSALLNFLAAAVGVGGGLVALFRWGFRPRRPGPSEEPA